VHAPPFLTQLVVLIAIAAFGAALFARWRLPSIAGFLVVGALLGPGGLGLVQDDASVRALARFGVVFLLFEIGLELPLDRLRRMWRVGLAAGALQVAGTLLAVASVATLLGVPGRSAVVLGALVAMSSTALVIQLLGDRGELDTPHGQISVAILLFQDVCIVPFLLAIPLLAHPGSLTGLPVLLAFGRAVLAIGVFFALARLVLPRMLEAAARVRSREVFSLVALLVVMGAGWAAAQLGLTLAVGAFLAGLAARATPYGPQLFAEVLPLRGILLGAFFTAVGMLLDLGEATRLAPQIGLFLLAAVPLKALLIGAVVAGALRQGRRMGILSGLALAQTGEFSFVLGAAAVAGGLLSADLQQTFVAGSVITLIATPFLTRSAPRLAEWLSGSAAQPGAETPGVPARRAHVVLVGYGLVGRNAGRVLRALGVPFVALETNPQAVREAQAAGDDVVFGDATRPGLLEQLGIAHARLAVVVINDPVATRQIVTRIHEVAPGVRIVARTRYLLEVDALHEAGASQVVAEELEGTIDLVSHVLREFDVTEGAVERFAAELRLEAYALLRAPAALDLDPWMAELLEQVATEWVEVPARLHGEPSLVDLDLRARTGASVLAIDRGGHTTPNPSPSTTLRSGDRLLLFGGREAVARLRALLEEQGRAG